VAESARVVGGVAVWILLLRIRSAGVASKPSGLKA
jgi:hypothetical protein